MTDLQKIIKYIAIGLAAFLIVVIIASAISILGVLGLIFDGSATENAKDYTVSADITSLYVDVSTSDITIKQGEAFSVESNLKNIKVSDKSGILTIKESKKLFENYDGSMLIITVPTNTVFKKVEIKTGAGSLSADILSTKTLECDFGAGEIKINDLIVSSKADIEGGVGNITVLDGTVNDLDCNISIGELKFTAALTGKCEFELGIGDSEIALIGEKDDYTFEIEKGLGNIIFNGEKISNTEGLGNGVNKVEINGGVGSVNVVINENN